MSAVFPFVMIALFAETKFVSSFQIVFPYGNSISRFDWIIFPLFDICENHRVALGFRSISSLSIPQIKQLSYTLIYEYKYLSNTFIKIADPSSCDRIVGNIVLAIEVGLSSSPTTHPTTIFPFDNSLGRYAHE